MAPICSRHQATDHKADQLIGPFLRILETKWMDAYPLEAYGLHGGRARDGRVSRPSSAILVRGICVMS